MTNKRGEDGWLWFGVGEGNHIDANGHIDMVVCCPYIPEAFEALRNIEPILSTTDYRSTERKVRSANKTLVANSHPG